MISNFINKYFFYLYVFTLFFGVLFYNTTGFKGLDVASSLMLVGLYMVYIIGTKNKSFNIGLLVVLLVFLFFLNYSFYIANNSLNAIAIDFLKQLRPYLTFFLVFQMSPTFTEKQKEMLRKICFYVWLIFIPVGLLAVVNPSFLSSMMDQPSNYTACITFLSVVHLYCSNFTFKEKLTFVFMLATGLITFHAPFLIFFLIVCGLIMYFHHIDVLKSNLKTGFAIAVITGLVVYVSRAEIVNYFSLSGIGGGGFASFATQATSGFYTQLNNTGYNPVNGIFHQEWLYRSTSFYPFLAQLGITGILLYLSFWIYIFTVSIIRFRQKGDIQPFILVFALAVFVFLENISDSFFTSNKGYFMMMFVGLMLGKPEDTDNMVTLTNNKGKKKKKFAALQAIWYVRKNVPSYADNGSEDITYLLPPVPTKMQEPAVMAVAETSITETPVVETPVVDVPVAETIMEIPIVVDPVAETVIEIQPVDEPVVETVLEIPAVEEPVSETVMEIPAVEEPVSEPVMEIPAIEEPVSEPVMEIPAIEEPVSEPVMEIPTSDDTFTPFISVYEEESYEEDWDDDLDDLDDMDVDEYEEYDWDDEEIETIDEIEVEVPTIEEVVEAKVEEIEEEAPTIEEVIEVKVEEIEIPTIEEEAIETAVEEVETPAIEEEIIETALEVEEPEVPTIEEVVEVKIEACEKTITTLQPPVISYQCNQSCESLQEKITSEVEPLIDEDFHEEPFNYMI